MHRILMLAVALLAPAPICAQLVVTEIMFDPVTTHGCEYVEVFNPTERSIALRDWRIVDATGKTQATIAKSISVAPHRYLVIAADTNIYRQFDELRDSTNVVVLGRSSLGLNADRDVLVLFDRDDAAVDSVAYTADLHRPDIDERRGTSLERISLTAASTDQRNWTSSAGRNGGTPARENSVAIEPRAITAELDVVPNTVSPDGDGPQQRAERVDRGGALDRV
jgi:hypothetical protein